MTLSKRRKKLIKFIRDPRLFIEDSAFVASARTALVSLSGGSTSQSDSADDAACIPDSIGLASPTEHVTHAEIMAALAEACEVFFIDDESVDCLTICAMLEERGAVIEALLKFCSERHLAIRYGGGKQYVPMANASAIHDAIRGRNIFRLALTELASTRMLVIEVQFWMDQGEVAQAPAANAIARRAFRSALGEAKIPSRGEPRMLKDIVACPLEQDVTFDVDYVFSWVNGNDPDWQAMYRKYKPGVDNDGNNQSRFHNRDELKFSLRSLEAYAPWVRRIHVVSNCAPPAWLDTQHPRVRWVTHEEVFNSEDLPTFSSHAIESRLHHIEGLANHFIYSNDDFLLTRPAKKSDFFEPNGLCRLKLERWGSVHGTPKAGDPDYLNAGRNCQALLERDFGVSSTQLHHHAPQALRIDIMREMEDRYAEEFARTACARFRSITDIAVTGFLFHHYAYLTGRALKSNTRTLLIQQNHDFRKRYKLLHAQRNHVNVESRYLSACVNDGANSHLNAQWNAATAQFLGDYFAVKSQFER